MVDKRFTDKKNFNKSNIAKIPNDKPVIYKIKNSNGKNIYTGVAKRNRAEERLTEHLSGSKDSIPGAKSFSIKQKNTIESAKTEEKLIVSKEKPKYNKEYK